MKPLPLNSEENGQTIMTRHQRSALYGGSITEDYFQLIFNIYISFQSCNHHSTIYIRRSPRQHFLKYCRCAVYMQHMSFVVAFKTISVYVKLLQFCCIYSTQYLNQVPAATDSHEPIRTTDSASVTLQYKYNEHKFQSIEQYIFILNAFA